MALKDHVDGSVWTTIQVSPQGSIDKIGTEVVSAWNSARKLLVPPVEKAIRAAKVKPECTGQSVSVVFRYSIAGDPEPNPQATSKTLGSNVIWIESRPEGKPTL